MEDKDILVSCVILMLCLHSTDSSTDFPECLRDSTCSPMHAYCDYDTLRCTCLRGYKASSNKCVPSTLPKCESFSDCPPNAFCDNSIGRCYCTVNYEERSNECVYKEGYCIIDSDCSTNEVCYGNKCECKSGYEKTDKKCELPESSIVKIVVGCLGVIFLIIFIWVCCKTSRNDSGSTNEASGLRNASNASRGSYSEPPPAYNIAIVQSSSSQSSISEAKPCASINKDLSESPPPSYSSLTLNSS